MTSTTQTFAAIDIGPRITLAGQLETPDTDDIKSLSASWPLRAILRKLSVFISHADESAQGGSLPLGHIDMLGSANHLVCLGNTRLSAACRIAAEAGIDTVVAPTCRCALWSEGVVTFSEICEYHRVVESPLDLDLVRLRFVEMMEDAAGYTQALALEQDDSLLDRYAELQLPGNSETFTVPIESLTAMERFLRPLRVACPGLFDDSAQMTAITVQAVHMRCLFSSLYPLPRTEFDEAPSGWRESTTASGVRWYHRVNQGK